MKYLEGYNLFESGPEVKWCFCWIHERDLF